MSEEKDKSLRIGGIYFQLLNVQARFDTDPDGVEYEFDNLIRELEGLGFSQLQIDSMVAATECNPRLRELHQTLYVDHPRLPEESLREQLIRAFGERGKDIADELDLH